MDRLTKQMFESEYGAGQHFEYEFKSELFRIAEGVLFKENSNDLKYILGLRLRPIPILGQVCVTEYPIDINPHKQVSLYCHIYEPKIVGSVRTKLLRLFPFLYS